MAEGLVIGKEDLKLIAKWPHLLGRFVGMDKLTPLHSQWIKEVWLPGLNGEHASNQAHRGAFKTSALTVIGPVWWLLFQPDDRIAIIRETFTQACATIQLIGQVMQNEVIRALFTAAHGRAPKAIIDRADMITYDFKTVATKEGSLNAYGVEQVPTGSHFDVIHCDDFVTIKDMWSRARRERTKAAIREILTNIVDPGKPCHFVGTPWHRDDAWEMRNDAGELIIPRAKKYDCYTTNILTDKEIQEKRSRTTKAQFAINYELRHVAADDALFSDVEFGTWPALKAIKAYAHLDAAYGGDDTNALTIMTQLPSGKFVAVGKSWSGHVEQHIPAIRAACAQYGVSALHLETNADKGFLGKLLRVQLNMPVAGATIPQRLRIHTYSESMNKHLKISTYLAHYWKDITWLEETDNEYMSTVMDYREGSEPDDAPDSAASLLREGYYPGDTINRNNKALHEE